MKYSPFSPRSRRVLLGALIAGMLPLAAAYGEQPPLDQVPPQVTDTPSNPPSGDTMSSPAAQPADPGYGRQAMPPSAGAQGPIRYDDMPARSSRQDEWRRHETEVHLGNIGDGTS